MKHTCDILMFFLNSDFRFFPDHCNSFFKFLYNFHLKFDFSASFSHSHSTLSEVELSAVNDCNYLAAISSMEQLLLHTVQVVEAILLHLLHLFTGKSFQSSKI